MPPCSSTRGGATELPSVSLSKTEARSRNFEQTSGPAICQSVVSLPRGCSGLGSGACPRVPDQEGAHMYPLNVPGPSSMAIRVTSSAYRRLGHHRRRPSPSWSSPQAFIAVFKLVLTASAHRRLGHARASILRHRLHDGAVGRGLPARVCHVRVGVGSIVPPPPTGFSDREQRCYY